MVVTMSNETLEAIRQAYGRQSNLLDVVEFQAGRLREKILGVDCSIFDRTILYYREVHGEDFSKHDALLRARDKARHKNRWFERERRSLEEKISFYQEVHVYPFRQPYLKRFGGFRWYVDLVNHFDRPKVLEYGCGSAVLTEYWIDKLPNCRYTVADIPSVTLDFVEWKRAKYDFPYEILIIGRGNQGIPLHEDYDLIVCQDVLEHTPNPVEIVTSFSENLSPAGVLVIDFINAPGGENLQEAVEHRESVKRLLKADLIALKAIDEPKGANGLYVKPLEGNRGNQ